MSLVTRKIDLQFRLGTGAFGADGSNAIDLKGLRCSANISKTGGVSMSSLDLRVYGMALETMNKLTILNQILYTAARLNQVTVSAGDTDTGTAVCFTGIISEAWADLRSSPDAAFHVSAHTGLLDAVKPVPPVSYRGSVDVATVLAGIAAQMQPTRTLENSGVTATISDPYLPGTLRDQALAVARAAGINMLIDDTVLAIWPKDSTRAGQIPIVSPATGLVGYPQFTQNGLQLTTLYNPSLVFGQTIDVRDTIGPAVGKWVISSVTHNLEAETPGGQWFTRMDCGLLGAAAPIISG